MFINLRNMLDDHEMLMRKFTLFLIMFKWRNVTGDNYLTYYN